MMVNLSQLSVSELRMLMAQLQQAGKSAERDELVQARAAILAMAHGAGVSLGDLLATPPRDPHGVLP